MKRKRRLPEQIIRKLREADRWLSEGKTIADDAPATVRFAAGQPEDGFPIGSDIVIVSAAPFGHGAKSPF